MKWEDLILPTELDNVDQNFNRGNKDFRTIDFIFLDDFDFLVYHDPIYAGIKENYCYRHPNYSDSFIRYNLGATDLSDYAIMCGATQTESSDFNFGELLRSPYSMNYIYSVRYNGVISAIRRNADCSTLRPCMHLNLAALISAQKKFCNFGEISISKGVDGKLYHTIQLGEFPKTHAKNSADLEKMFQIGALKSTGKNYVRCLKKEDIVRDKEDLIFTSNAEFMYNGKKYVRVVCKKKDDGSHLSDGMKRPETGEISWAVVEPIAWEIRNWDEMPREINPNGSGNAKFVDVKSRKCIVSGLPFYPRISLEDCDFVEFREDMTREELEGCDLYRQIKCGMWQNSVPRAWLNGYDLQKEICLKRNGNAKFWTGHNYNFKECGFLQEAGMTGEIFASVEKFAKNHNEKDRGGKE